eukprot:TRINITY_DN69543_c0_g1_i1.p1 TRINITY_DN69543_c0_g1~~TRINITY_DN69543_c0_g1_i1.p1  ORF type:complete len:678 (+),score=249.44 TRINITY_DN69543_c0_g1_i1:113-2146(+)
MRRRREHRVEIMAGSGSTSSKEEEVARLLRRLEEAEERQRSAALREDALKAENAQLRSQVGHIKAAARGPGEMLLQVEELSRELSDLRRQLARAHADAAQAAALEASSVREAEVEELQTSLFSTRQQNSLLQERIRGLADAEAWCVSTVEAECRALQDRLLWVQQRTEEVVEKEKEELDAQDNLEAHCKRLQRQFDESMELLNQSRTRQDEFRVRYAEAMEKYSEQVATAVAAEETLQEAKKDHEDQLSKKLAALLTAEKRNKALAGQLKEAKTQLEEDGRGSPKGTRPNLEHRCQVLLQEYESEASKFSAARSACMNIEEQRLDLQDELDGMQETHSPLEPSGKSQGDTCRELEARVEEWKRRCDEREGYLASVKLAESDANASVQNCKKRLSFLQRDLSETSQEHSTLRKELEQSATENKQLVMTIARWKTEEHALRLQHEKLSDERDRAQTRAAAASEYNTAVERRNEHLAENNLRMMQKNARFEQECKEVRVAVAKASKEREVLLQEEDACRQRREEHLSAATLIVSLRDDCCELHKVLESAEVQLACQQEISKATLLKDYREACILMAKQRENSELLQECLPCGGALQGFAGDDFFAEAEQLVAELRAEELTSRANSMLAEAVAEARGKDGRLGASLTTKQEQLLRMLDLQREWGKMHEELPRTTGHSQNGV